VNRNRPFAVMLVVMLLGGTALYTQFSDNVTALAATGLPWAAVALGIAVLWASRARFAVRDVYVDEEE